jgi:hypothetical protein
MDGRYLLERKDLPISFLRLRLPWRFLFYGPTLKHLLRLVNRVEIH